MNTFSIIFLIFCATAWFIIPGIWWIVRQICRYRNFRQIKLFDPDNRPNNIAHLICGIPIEDWHRDYQKYTCYKRGWVIDKESEQSCKLFYKMWVRDGGPDGIHEFEIPLSQRQQLLLLDRFDQLDRQAPQGGISPTDELRRLPRYRKWVLEIQSAQYGVRSQKELNEKPSDWRRLPEKFGERKLVHEEDMDYMDLFGIKLKPKKKKPRNKN